jgi:putative heme transporter
VDGAVVTDAAVPRRRRHRDVLRVAAGVVAGIAILAALVRLRSEAHTASGILPTLRAGERDLVALAATCELAAYVLPAVALRLLVPGLRFGPAARIALASLGVGPLLPANPLTGSGIAYAELRRCGVAQGRAAVAGTTLVIGLPAASMAALAGPALVASGLYAPLPAGWRDVVLAAGAGALALTAAMAVVLARPAAIGAAGRAVAAVGGRRTALRLGVLGAGAWIADASALVVCGLALHVHLPLSVLPIAYIAGVTVMSLPVLPSGLGAVEATLPLVFAAGGATYADALLVVLVWRVLSFWLPTLAGIAALAALHRPRAAVAAHSTLDLE